MSKYDSPFTPLTPSAASLNLVPGQPMTQDERMRYNGRLNLVDLPPPEMQMQLFEKVAVRNKATDFREALGNDMEPHLLAQVFFSKENIQILQNGIRAGVYHMSQGKMTVAPQNPDTIKVIMRSIYLQYARHDPKNIREQVEYMNNLVLNYAVENTYSSALMYLRYLEDVSTLPTPVDRPQQIDRNFHELEFKGFF